jgi:hypothetical protein
LACDTSYSFETGCQTGWYNYCNQPATFTSNACQNFYSSSYKNGSLDSTVRTNLKNLCATITMTNGVLNETIDPTIQSVCGCYLPDSVYNAFKSQPFAFSHDCFSAVSNVPGCNLTQCCVYVCVNDSSCCSIGWDAACVNQARTNTELCQSGALTATAVSNWASPPPAPGIPSFEPVEIDSGTTTNFKARNLALFGNERIKQKAQKIKIIMIIIIIIIIEIITIITRSWRLKNIMKITD